MNQSTINPTTPTTHGAPSVGELLGDLTAQTKKLVRQELRLASTELGEKGKQAALDGAIVAAGGTLAHAGLLVLLLAAVAGLAEFMPLWIAALIVGVAALAGGYAFVRTGLARFRGIDPKPQRTIETLRQDKLMLKEQLR